MFCAGRFGRSAARRYPLDERTINSLRVTVDPSVPLSNLAQSLRVTVVRLRYASALSV